MQLWIIHAIGLESRATALSLEPAEAGDVEETENT